MELYDLRVVLGIVFVVTSCQTLVLGANSTVVSTAGASAASTATPTSNPSSSSGIASGSTASSVTTPNAPGTATSVSPTISTPSVEEVCQQKNGSCDECLGVAGAKCLWCYSDNSCQAYPLSKVLPPSDMCALDQARWGVCWLNFEAMIIAVSVIGGIIILTVTCCCVYCCCCRNANRRKYEKEDARYNAQKMQRKAKSDDRRAERKERLDEIRRKYGLMKDEPYQRFES